MYMTDTLVKILIVGAGSCTGGIARYLVSQITRSGGQSAFPWGTFMVNMLGCFIIGLVYGFLDRGFQLSEGMKLFLTVGFCGGFTTFSTFMHENYLLCSDSGHLTMLLYAVGSVAAGLLLVYLAYTVTRIL